MPEKTVAAEVEPDFKQAVRMAAAARGISMSEYLRIALNNQLDEDGEGNLQAAMPAVIS